MGGSETRPYKAKIPIPPFAFFHFLPISGGDCHVEQRRLENSANRSPRNDGLGLFGEVDEDDVRLARGRGAEGEHI